MTSLEACAICMPADASLYAYFQFSTFNFQFYTVIILSDSFLGKSNIRIEIFPQMGYNGSSKTQK
jgi:hypothetical protein